MVSVLAGGSSVAPPRGMAAYLSAVRGGESVLVRPRAGYPGLEKTVGLVAGLAPGVLTVTDVADLLETVEPGEVPPGPGAAPSHRTGDDEAGVVGYHSSGSTGLPKCVVYRGATVRAHARLIASSLGLDASHRYASLTPPNFAYGLSILNSHELSGVPISFTDDAAELAAAYAGTDEPLTLYLLPQQASLLASIEDALPLERVITAGGRVSGPTVESLLRRYPELRLTAMYGQAELGPRLALWDGPLAEFVPGTLGQPIGDVEFRLDDAEASGRTQLLVNTPHAMSWTIPAPYDAVLPGPAPDAVVATGDYAALDEQGRYVHTGRREDLANVAGTKVLLGDLSRSLEAALPLAGLRVTKRKARVSGDDVPVVELVPAPGASFTAADVRRALRDEWGPLVALLDVKLVDRITISEAGK